MDSVNWTAVAYLLAALAIGTFVTIGYVNNVLSLRDRIRGRNEKPTTAEQMEIVQNRLDEIASGMRQAESPPIDTAALAAAATDKTAELLQEAIDLQTQHRERDAIEVLLEAFRRDLPPAARAELHLLIGNSFGNLSALEEAEGHFRQSLDAARAGELQNAEAKALGNLGSVYTLQSDFPRAEQHYSDALKIHSETGNSTGAASVLRPRYRLPTARRPRTCSAVLR